MPTAPKKPTSEDEQPEAAKAAREAQREATPEDDDVERFDHDFLVKAAGAVGYRPHEVRGALSALPKKHLTIEEAAAATKAWLEAPVATDPYFETEA